MTNNWSNSPFNNMSHRPYAQEREPSHGLPMQNHSLQMREYDRSMGSSIHSTLNSIHGHR